MQRENLNVPKDGIYSESDSSCYSRISESTSLSGATVASINKKLKAKRKHSNVLAAKKETTQPMRHVKACQRRVEITLKNHILQQRKECQRV